MTLHPAQVFLSTLFGETPREVFQVFPDHPGSDVRAAHRALPWLEAEPLLSRLNDRGAGVFVTINRSRTGGRTAADIDAVRCLFVDGDGVALPDLWPCPPTLVQVREAGATDAAGAARPHWQAFWRLAPGELLASFSPAQKALAAWYGGDPRVHDLPRVMRLPGFRHQKDPAAPTSYRIASVDAAAVYTIVEVLAAHGIDPMAVAAAVDDEAATPEAMTLPVDPRPEEVAAAAALFDRPVEVNGRHHTALALAIECVAAGMDDAELKVRLTAWFVEHGRTPQPREVPNLIRDARKGVKAGRFTATTPGVGARTDFTAVPSGPAVPAAGALTPDAAAAQAKDLTAGNWRDRVVTNRDGSWKSHVQNVLLVLQNMPEVSQCFRFNLFTNAVEVSDAPWRPWDKRAQTQEWCEEDPVSLAAWIAQLPGHPAISPDVVHQAVRPFARLRSYHPVRDYLGALSWDGRPRLSTWLIRYWGATDTPYTRAVGARFLIGAVARVMIPGCKLDTMLIAEGAQGIGKSTAVRVLFDPWYTDADLDVSNKDASAIIRGHWGVEFGEMHGAKRAEVTQLKAFLSRREDRQRDAYGRVPETHKRQGVFVGTTNSSDYLLDQTGGRRFWPVACGRIDLERLTADKAQLWAEAYHRQQAGEAWWLTEEEETHARAEQAQRRTADEAEDLVGAWLARGGDFGAAAGEGKALSPLMQVTGIEVWTGALGGSPVTFRRVEQQRVADILRALGWKRVAIRRGEHVIKGYTRLLPLL